jgi:hypothetical protein
LAGDARESPRADSCELLPGSICADEPPGAVFDVVSVFVVAVLVFSVAVWAGAEVTVRREGLLVSLLEPQPAAPRTTTRTQTRMRGPGEPGPLTFAPSDSRTAME